MCLRMICAAVCNRRAGKHRQDPGQPDGARTAWLIERRGSRYQPVEVTGKKDLSSAPVLRRLAEGEG